jgi:hypothetical protein
VTPNGKPSGNTDKPVTYEDVRVDGKIVAVIGDKIKISYKKPDKRTGTATTKGGGNVGDKVIVFLKHETFKFSNFVVPLK